MYYRGSVEESKGCGGEEEEADGDAVAAFAHAVAPVGAPSASMYCCGGVEESKGCDSGEEEADGEAAVAFAHAVAPEGAPSAAAARL
jgi:hypothetical protein